MNIEIQLPNTSLGEIEKFAEHFGLKAYKTKTRFFYRIEGDDPMQFYWLGANMGNALLNKLQPSPLSKFIEL